MHFYPKGIFHIFNQGNNRQRIFFTDENYRFFLWKMRAYLLPFGDLIAWCLMPNHFHWLFRVSDVEIPRQQWKIHVEQVEALRKRRPCVGVTRVHADTKIDLNESIGILQRSYTRAINRQENRTGSLFREKCKAEDGWNPGFYSISGRGGKLFKFCSGSDYLAACFDYIHQNPVKAGFVTCPENWPWSSARDYAGLRKGTLCNLELGMELLK
ncbi:MAG: hypothetical protein D6765_05790 [Bacteroidetes bacterium]|nr:MAG: hypothetical protein D6765_05790 [Bacteroidota bacterium]